MPTFEPWMLIAAGLVVLTGAFIVITWRMQRPSKPQNDPDAQTRGHEDTETDPPQAEVVEALQPQPVNDTDEAFVLRTDSHGREVRRTHRRDVHAARDVHVAQKAHAASMAADGAAQVERLVADVKSHADRRVEELDVLISQARRHVEDLQRQSAELAKTLQAAKNEAARRQADAIERAAVARAIEACETLAASIDPDDKSTLPVTNPMARLNATRTDPWPIPAQRPPTTTEAPTPDGAGAFVGSRHREVLLLLDQNRPAVEISRTLGLEVGEIELIASLNGRRMARAE